MKRAIAWLFVLAVLLAAFTIGHATGQRKQNQPPDTAIVISVDRLVTNPDKAVAAEGSVSVTCKANGAIHLEGASGAVGDTVERLEKAGFRTEVIRRNAFSTK